MPQEPRNPREEALFQVGLRQMNELFLQGKVIALATNDSYFHRAWCLMEFFCHLLSPHERPIVVVSLDNPSFLAHMVTVIEGEKYAEGNIIGVEGWKPRIMKRVEEGRTTIPTDKEVVLSIMDKIDFAAARSLEGSMNGCIEFLSPKGTTLMFVN
jgi:hypothetical protein